MMLCYSLVVALAIATSVIAGQFDFDTTTQQFPIVALPPPPPPPIADTSGRLVHDAAHPWHAPEEGDMRGPCPGLNTLASHGWLPRDGVATPAQIITAVQEGFNMGYDLAAFVTYAGHIVDGNLLTNKLSIGQATNRTGPPPPPPAHAGGLSAHGAFEGDASITRGDAYLGDNDSFNATLFDEFVSVSEKYGGGAYDFAAAGALRMARIRDSIARNPYFRLLAPRYHTAYAESVFPIAFFIDGRRTGAERTRLDPAVARGFFESARMPPDFWRSSSPWGRPEVGIAVDALYRAHPISPGSNNGTVDSYTHDPTSPRLHQFCEMYTDYVNVTVRELYPNAKGVLLAALNKNLDYLYSALGRTSCPQVPPFV
ncbi:hypothetical protein HYPSUDRAFT_193960 [Hypholoma sublateritium FD-334 SS-4]|uniref:Heme haloperoxidase family profile domain-containing protein n=1 Tax=Hypholoma sublateritium (strain FD-334 SS-4) TaxID=945553 RepID=A0A0D2P5W7_HYPSF|nr:hypothetical protein HYPSUDRAFT_193960 [Hypholoma sublateritium FD-334 SS-4]